MYADKTDRRAYCDVYVYSDPFSSTYSVIDVRLLESPLCPVVMDRMDGTATSKYTGSRQCRETASQFAYTYCLREFSHFKVRKVEETRDRGSSRLVDFVPAVFVPTRDVWDMVSHFSGELRREVKLLGFRRADRFELFPACYSVSASCGYVFVVRLVTYPYKSVYDAWIRVCASNNTMRLIGVYVRRGLHDRM